MERQQKGRFTKNGLFAMYVYYFMYLKLPQFLPGCTTLLFN